MSSKACANCRVIKPFSEFGRDRHMSDGLNCRCKECRRADSRRYRVDHPERMAAYRERTRDEQNVRTRAWYRANREEHIARTAANRRANRERARELGRAQARANPGRVIAKNARNRGATVIEKFTIEELSEHLRSFGIDPDLCMYCRDAPRAEWDHIVAIILGGSHTLGNMAPACRRCNSLKAVSERAESQRRRRAA